MIFTFVLTLSAGGQQRAGPPGGGRAGAAVSPSGWGGSRTAEKSGAVAVPWYAVVPSVAHGGGRPSGVVGCATRVVASAIRSRPVVLASYSAVSASATSVELGTLCPGWEAARPTLIVSTACGLTPRCSMARVCSYVRTRFSAVAASAMVCSGSRMRNFCSA